MPARKKTESTDAIVEKLSKEPKVKKERAKKMKPSEAQASGISLSDEAEIKCIAEAMLDKKAQKVCSLDLSKIGTAIADHFIVCNADSSPQVNAIADNVEEMMYTKCNRKVIRAQGKENAFWIILDYANIVVHIFKTEYREFYRLEELWADAAKTTYQD